MSSGGECHIPYCEPIEIINQQLRSIEPVNSASDRARLSIIDDGRRGVGKDLRTALSPLVTPRHQGRIALPSPR